MKNTRPATAILDEINALLNFTDHIDFQDGEWEADMPDKQMVYHELFQKLDKHIDFSESRKNTVKTSRLSTRPVKIRRSLLRIAAILFITVSIGITISYLQRNSGGLSRQNQPAASNDVMPGGNRATLTLADGKQIVLDQLQNGQIAVQMGSTISKTHEGQLYYAPTTGHGNPAQGASNWNTIAVPKGGRYNVTLSDGTRVYLNSASTLSYPTSFYGKTRNIKLVGEGYFEVAKNTNKPFIVNVNGKQNIQVLGTHFNVEAYQDEQQIRTTLLEGSVKITYGTKETLLKPDQMALTDMTNSTLTLNPADTEEVMAWKDNMFIFSNENIVSIMRRLSRWYDIDVVFIGNNKNVNFGGNYSREKTLANLLKNIELTEKVKFEIQGRRVTVIAK